MARRYRYNRYTDRIGTRLRSGAFFSLRGRKIHKSVIQ
nr:MAG TPA: hypothetical protein [Caudoviricetes sp.]